MTSTLGKFGITADDSLDLAQDPTTHSQWVLRVRYAKGSYAGSGGHRGAQFYGTPSTLTSHSYTTLTLEYEVYFLSPFDWVNGGKLPGLWGGTRDCSGGRIQDSCFSTRLMWRTHGDGEVYAYVTHDQENGFKNWCAKYDHSNTPTYKHVHCTNSTGIEMGTSAWRFRTNHWHKIRQEVHLNANPGQKGYIKLWVDGHAEVHVTDVIMRNNTAFAIDGLLFSTFFGGNKTSFASTDVRFSYFKNFRISTDTMAPSITELVG